MNKNILFFILLAIFSTTAFSSYRERVLTTRGDLLYRNSSNKDARLPVGTSSYVLTSDGTDVSWAAPSGGTSIASGTSSVAFSGANGDIELTSNGTQFAELLTTGEFVFKNITSASYGGRFYLENPSGTNAAQIYVDAANNVVFKSDISTYNMRFFTSAGDFIFNNGTYNTDETVLARTKTSTQTVNDGVTANVDFETNVFDVASGWQSAVGAFSSSTGLYATTQPGYVAPEDGYYLVIASIAYTAPVATDVRVFVNVNGSNKFEQNNDTPAANTTTTAVYLAYANKGELIQIRTLPRGGNYTITTASGRCKVAIYRIGI